MTDEFDFGPGWQLRAEIENCRRFAHLDWYTRYLGENEKGEHWFRNHDGTEWKWDDSPSTDEKVIRGMTLGGLAVALLVVTFISVLIYPPIAVAVVPACIGIWVLAWIAANTKN